jgi:hypothetical protein
MVEAADSFKSISSSGFRYASLVSGSGWGFWTPKEIRDIKDSISFLADTQRILSENILLQQQQFNEFQQILNAAREESERRQQESERRLNEFLEEGRRNRQESERRFEGLRLLKLGWKRFFWTNNAISNYQKNVSLN